MDEGLSSPGSRLQLAPSLLSRPLIPLFPPHQSRFNLTLTGAPDKTHYSLNYAVYLASSSSFLSPLSASPFRDAPGLLGALSGRRWRFPPDSIAGFCISVLLISLGGTIAFLFISSTEQMWAREGGESNGGTTGSCTPEGKRAAEDGSIAAGVEGSIPPKNGTNTVMNLPPLPPIDSSINLTATLLSR